MEGSPASTSLTVDTTVRVVLLVVVITVASDDVLVSVPGSVLGSPRSVVLVDMTGTRQNTGGEGRAPDRQYCVPVMSMPAK